MFCLTCKRLSPPGSLYCQHCPGGKSFNCRICAGGHRCSAGGDIATCPHCGRNEFSEPVWGIPTGWLAKAASVAALIALWKIGLAHHDRILPVLADGAAYAFGMLTNSDSHALGGILQNGFSLAVAGWMLGLFLYLLPGQGGVAGKFLRGFPVRIGQWGLRWLPRLLTSIWKATTSAVGLSGGKVSSPTATTRPGKGD